MKNTHSVIKIFRINDIIISLSILAVGLILTFLVPSWRWLGVTCLATAVFMIPFYKTGYHIKSQKGVFQKKEFILPLECEAEIVEYVEGNAESLELNPYNKGGLLMELYYNKDNSKNFVQISDCVSNKYITKSKFSEISTDKLDNLLKYQI